MDKKYCFIILHYLTIDDTKRCVESINTLFENYNYNIVIVDNASSNGTGKVLEEEYSNNSKIRIISSKVNLGFARGNNLGFKYAKQELNPDYIIMINNDTFFEQKDFLDVVDKTFSLYNFALMGPKIILKDNSVHHMNEKLRTVSELEKGIRKLKLNRFLNKIYLLSFFRKIKSFFKNNNQVSSSNPDIYDVNVKVNVIIHGCCFIFSRKYIDKFDGLPDRTFLYCEEDLLFIRLIQNNLSSVYNPQAEIRHNEDSSTDALTKNNRKKNEFVFKNLLLSDKILLEETKKLGDDYL